MTAPSGDWAALGRAVRNRRRALGIPTQREAATQAGMSYRTWQSLEAGHSVKGTTLNAAATALGWDPDTVAGILSGGHPTGTGPLDRPALVYHATDGSTVRLDRDDLTTLPARERALCAALLDHARTQLDHAATASVIASHIPTAHDHQDGP